MRHSLLLALAAFGTIAAAQAPTGVGYPNPRAAYDALRADPGAKGGVRDGWMIVAVESGANEGVWSFTPKEHPAHPAVIRRIPIEKDGKIFIHTGMLCGAEKSICDSLYQEFVRLNEGIAREAQDKRETQGK